MFTSENVKKIKYLEVNMIDKWKYWQFILSDVQAIKVMSTTYFQCNFDYLLSFVK